MTYNFDPDKWYENHLRVLDHRLEIGEIDEARHRTELEALDQRYDEMLRRLDGSYAIPEASS